MSNDNDDKFVFAKEGERFFLQRMVETNASPTLDAGLYSIGFCMRQGYFFKRLAGSFNMPPKLYGDTVERRCARILNTFRKRDRSTGVLLNGRKGSGKTLLAKHICNMSEMPVIIVTQPHCDAEFLELLKNIKQDKIVFFDEFEKVYHDCDSQNFLLTLLDGVYDSRTLFLLTTNSTSEIAPQMKNRTGRIFYAINFDGLDDEFVRSYALEHLHRKENAETLVRLNTLVDDFNFDLMASIIEECNRYQCSPKDCLEMMNVEGGSTYVNYRIHITWRGKPLALQHSVREKYFDVQDGRIDVAICPDWFEKQNPEEFADFPPHMYQYPWFTFRHLVDMKDGTFRFLRDEIELRLTPVKSERTLLDLL